MTEFERIYEQWRFYLLVIARKSLAIDEAEDVVSFAFVQAWKKKVLFENAKAFLIVTLKNKIRDVLATKEIERRNIQQFAYYESISENDEIKAEVIKNLHQQVSKLDNRNRQVASLLLKGYSLKEVAEKLNMQYQTVKNQRGIAIKKLGKLLNDNENIFYEF